jgi:hypothetical protein
MAHKQLFFCSEAREKILRGAAALADAVRVTATAEQCPAASRARGADPPDRGELRGRRRRRR